MLKRRPYEEIFKGYVVHNNVKHRFENQVELVRYQTQVLENELEDVIVIFDSEPETSIEITIQGDVLTWIDDPVHDEYMIKRRLRIKKYGSDSESLTL
jgi:hypothetical protein